VVLEQSQLTGEGLAAEVSRLVGDVALRSRMSAGARALAKPDAARMIAQRVMELARA
jgi:UDP-N-acetylglucosamine:LPS N-acetylglucosamine transferase